MTESRGWVSDTFESIHRRKKLAAWLGTLRGPMKPKPSPMNNAGITGEWNSEQTVPNPYGESALYSYLCQRAGLCSYAQWGAQQTISGHGD